MDGTPAVATRLAEHDTALCSLLESLLAEIPVADPDSVCQPPVAAIGRRTPVFSPEPAVNEPRGEPLTTLSGSVPLPQRAVPAWAGQSFRALVFEVGDQRFAMPLILMRSIGLLDAPLTRVPGQPVWQRGLLKYRGRPVVVAELGPLLGVDVSCRAPRYLLVIGDGRVALVCDRIEDAVAVEPEQVGWRRAGPSRAWLAGVLRDQMCILLDADAISSEIRHG